MRRGRQKLRVWLGITIAAALILGGYFVLIQLGYLPSPLVREPLPLPTPAETRDERWRQDIRYLADNLIYLHPNAFHAVGREDFERAVDELLADVTVLEDAEIWTRMSALAAMLRDGHTRLLLHEPGYFRVYPVQFNWYDDPAGYEGKSAIVVAAHPDYADVLGARVVRIGGLEIDSAAQAIRSLVSFDNPQQLLQQSALLLRTAEALYTQGVLEDMERAAYVFEHADGTIIRHQFAPGAVDEPSSDYVSIYDVLDAPTPVRLLNDRDIYWFTYLEDTRTLYLQYNAARSDPEKPFTDFTREVMAFVDSNSVERFVVDLRYNGGGNSSVIRPLIDAIRERPAINAEGHLYVLIGRRTFSSAMMNAIDFDTQTAALLVGEPTGGRPNGYGEVRTFSLPNSGIEVQYSTRYFRNVGDDTLQAVLPDVPVAFSWADLLEGRDPVLEAAVIG
jgi:hypothetical protein